MKALKLAMVISAYFLFALHLQVNAQNKKTGYAPVNGLNMYYEIHGSGQPIVLLHGAYMTLEGPIRQMAESLSKSRRVILLESQGHGRTADINRDITYEQMADDVAAAIKFLKIDSADIFGYSMGAATALQLTIRHPRLVKKLILASVAYNLKGWSPDLLKLIPSLTPAVFEGTPYKKEYDSLAPKKENFPVLVDKLKRLDMAPQDWPASDLKSIKSPVFLIFGDSDAVTLEHAVEMFKLFGGGVMGDVAGLPASRFAVLPATTHVSVMYQLNLLLQLIQPFLKN